MDKLKPVDEHALHDMVNKAIADIQAKGELDLHQLHLHDILHSWFIHTNGTDVVCITQWSDDLPTLSFDKTFKQCTDCMAAKSTRRNRPGRSTCRAAKPLDLIHMDIAGPFAQSTQNGKIYFLVLVDDHSCKSWVYLLSKRSQATVAFKHFCKSVGGPDKVVQVRAMQSDNAKEFIMGKTK
eukprot:3675166-Rhodomonas_salina.1